MRRASPVLLSLALLLGFGVSRAAAQEMPKPSVVSHDIEGKENCLMCHKAGVMGAPAVSEKHEGIANEQCLLCHGESSPVQTATPPKISHELEGKENCMMCHKTGVMEAPKAPESHAAIENESCGLCHKPAA